MCLITTFAVWLCHADLRGPTVKHAASGQHDPFWHCCTEMRSVASTEHDASLLAQLAAVLAEFEENQ